MQKMSEWISIKDRLPLKAGVYITYTPKSGTVRTKRFLAINIYSKIEDEHRLRFFNGGGVEDKNVSHWMPLPEPPK